MLPLPVPFGRVAPDGRINRQVRALSAAICPALAIERMGAVPAEKPRIPCVENERHLPAELRQRAQIEVGAVQIMTMNDIGCLRRQVEEFPGAGEIKIFVSQFLFQPSVGFTGTREQLANRLGGQSALFPLLEANVESLASLRPRTPAFVVRNREYVRITSPFGTDSQPAIMSESTVRLE